MQLFKCTHCGNPVYFENVFCGHCGSSLGFDTGSMKTIAFTPGNQFRYCANYSNAVCNWLLPVNSNASFCIACDLNRTIPPLTDFALQERWKKIEIAKHRLVYGLLRLGLPINNKMQDPERGLAFDLLTDVYGENVITGHQDGLITLNVKEADEIEREMAKRNLQELYRTLLGHFRHEIAHYYWDLLIGSNNNELAAFRQLFGDDSADYQEAMNRHYQFGAPLNWSDQYISAYATMHPWEDWAETWAHYMHITDTLETAYSFGLSVDPLVARGDSDLSANIRKDPYRIQSFDEIYHMWLPLTFAMNSMNRSMGLPDLYPFLINDTVKSKLSFVHELIRRTSTDTSS